MEKTRQTKINAIALVIGAILLLFVARTGLAATTAGRVVTFNGSCFVVSGERRTALKMGDTVHVGDVIEVPNDAKLKLLMADGSVLSLASGSKMTIKNYDDDPATGKRDAQLSFDKGLMRSVVAKASSGSRFEVETATGVAAARSTDWFVEASPRDTTFSVLEGIVAVARRGTHDPGAPTEKPKEGSEPARVGKSGKYAKTVPNTPQGDQDVLLTSYTAGEIGPGDGPPTVRPRSAAEFELLIERTGVRFGWCQCIADLTAIRATCVPTPQGCKAACTGTTTSFIPDAYLTCAFFYGETAARGPKPR